MKHLKIIAISFFSAILVYVLGTFLATILFQITYSEYTYSLQNALALNTSKSLLLYSLSLQTISIFLVPALVFMRLRKMSFHLEYQENHFKTVILVPLLLIFACLFLPGISFLSDLNISVAKFGLGVESSFIKVYEQSDTFTKYLLSNNSTPFLFVSIFCFGVIPAVSEEFFFRGVVQRYLNFSLTKHQAVWIAAIVFSLFHVDVCNFIPRMLLGAFLGYVFVYTGNLWYSIVAHFLHNSIVVFLNFLIVKSILPQSIETFGAIGNYSIVGVLSVICFALVIIFMARRI